jgi:uncharacterized protein
MSVTPSTKPEAGSLTAEQRDLVVRHLPVDVSLADEHGTLVYWHGEIFADCDERFIGRHMNDCHAPKSRRTIERMETAFKEGTRDEAVFWHREDDGRLYLFRYAAVRDAEGAYRGLMETVQDITDIVGIDGERTDLDW